MTSPIRLLISKLFSTPQKKGPLTLAADSLETELVRQIEESRQKKMDSFYWRDVGYIQSSICSDVMNILYIIRSLEPTAKKSIGEAYALFDRMEVAVRADPDDEDGYGIATFHELRRAFEAGLHPKDHLATTCVPVENHL